MLMDYLYNLIILLPYHTNRTSQIAKKTGDEDGVRQLRLVPVADMADGQHDIRNQASFTNKSSIFTCVCTMPLWAFCLIP